jgi:hypothetical protein
VIKKTLLAFASIVVILVAVAGAMFLGNTAPKPPAISAADAANPAKPFVIKLHAQWCVVCLATKDVWSEIEAAYSRHANLLVFDFTSDASTEVSRADAKRLGLEKAFDENGGSTGMILVLDGRTKEVVASIVGSRDFSEYRAAIDPLLPASK